MQRKLLLGTSALNNVDANAMQGMFYLEMQRKKLTHNQNMILAAQ